MHQTVTSSYITSLGTRLPVGSVVPRLLCDFISMHVVAKTIMFM